MIMRQGALQTPRALRGRIVSILIPLTLLCAVLIAVNNGGPAAAVSPGTPSAPGPAPQAAVSVYAGSLGPGTAADVGMLPAAVAVRGAQVYVADTLHHVIRRVDTDTGSVAVVAGNGFAGFSGDGGPATGTELYVPKGMALDAAGNLYIADCFNHRIRRVDASGIITTVAGDGTFGYAGDGGPATEAELNRPEDVALDGAGNLYIADVFNHRIRRVDAKGIITTVAGAGNQSDGGDGGLATSAQLNNPTGVALDAAGNIYIADFYNGRIRKVDTHGIITTVAGDGGPTTEAQFYGATRLAVDAAGNIYVADRYNNRIRRVDTSGIITTVAGNGSPGYAGDGGPALEAELNSPTGVAIDASGNLYIADSFNYRLRRVDTRGTITTMAGNGTLSYAGDGGPAIGAELNDPAGMALDFSGNLYFADSHNYRICRVDTCGTISTVAGNGSRGYAGDGGPATAAELSDPAGIALDADFNLYIADSTNSRIRKVDRDGNITTVAGDGTIGNTGDGGPATTARLFWPAGVAVDHAGNFYIADTGNNRIRKVDTSGIITTVAGTEYNGQSNNGDGGPATSALFSNPLSVALDGAGNIYITDTGSSRIRKVDTSGIITTVAGDGTAGDTGDGGPATAARLDKPTGLALDVVGNLYIVDTGNYRLRKVDPRGIITTVAGDSSTGYTGEVVTAGDDEPYRPEGVATDNAYILYVADSPNNRICKVTVPMS